jgi:hypothetical protein
VPRDFPARLDALKFNPEVMRQLFDEGLRFARANEWASVPPGLTPADQWPRGGVRFESREPARK